MTSNKLERERTPGTQYYTMAVELVIEAESEEHATSALNNILSDYEMADGILVDWDPLEEATTAGPSKPTVAERLAKALVYSDQYGKILLPCGHSGDRAAVGAFIRALEVDEDTAFNETSAALDAIAENGLEQVESELEYYCDTPDDYAHALFPWAQESKNMQWCDLVTSEKVTGRTLAEMIRAAQVEAKRYIWTKVIEWVRGLEEEEEYE